MPLAHITSLMLLAAVTSAVVLAESGAAQKCDAAGIATAALAPEGGLPTDWIGKLSPYMLYFQAIADFSYQKDIGTRISRKSPGPCLEAWGIKEWQRFDTENPLGAGLSFLLMRTDNDIILSIRGMVSRRDVIGQDALTNATYDPEAFGPEAVKFAAGKERILPNGKPNPDAFWTLEGYTISFNSVRAKAGKVLEAWRAKMNPKAKLWFVGHSDGSQLAQLGALKYALTIGVDAIGGVVLFGPSRVGSRGFATFYNTQLGTKTVYYSYGRDPALAYSYPISDGLMMPGVGIRACPVYGQAVEQLVPMALGEDKMAVCSELPLVNTPLSRLWLPDWVFGTSDPAFNQLISWEYLAHHIPAISYDGLVRMLNAGLGTGKPDACTLAALSLDKCVLSHVCSLALRPAGAAGCRGCATDDTCKQSWGMPNGRCDRSLPELSGWMCYNGKLPGTLLNLFYGSNGAPIDPDATYELEINNPFDRSNRRGSIATFKIPIGHRK